MSTVNLSKPRISKSKTLALLLLIALSQAVMAEDSRQKGLEVARAARAYDKGFTDYTANMIMTLKNKAGDTAKRFIRIRTLEVEGDGDKSLSIFDEPADVKGTAMLTYAHGLEPDDQWLYLPALKRVKRISSRNKSGPFMGSTKPAGNGPATCSSASRLTNIRVIRARWCGSTPRLTAWSEPSFTIAKNPC
jgi:hypothetical protein